MSRAQPTGPPPAPIVQRLTVRYAKRGRMRFASHRDVVRAIERGVRKAGLPVAYSAGFSPHPRISYADGVPTGSASEAEYLELSVTRRCEPADLGRDLDAALPDGIDVVEVTEADGKSAALTPEASEWEVVWPGVAPAAAQSAVAAFLDRPTAEVERLTTKGKRTLDARAAVVSLTVSVGPASARRAGTGQPARCAILRMIVRQLTPAVRPDDILTALRQSSALVPESPALATRLWQGSLASAGAAAGSLPEQHQRGPKTSGQERLSPGPRPEPPRPGCTTDKAQRMEAENAATAPAGQARADAQLPRGAEGHIAGQRAREPYGRDCPDARDRATESAVRAR